MIISAPSKRILRKRVSLVDGSTGRMIPSSRIILLYLPNFLVRRRLREVGPCLSSSACIKDIFSSANFFFRTRGVLSRARPL